MNDHAWFRLLVRVVGLFFVGYSGPYVVSSTIRLAISFSDMGWEYARYELVDVGGMTIQLVFGLYLLFFARGLIRRCLLDVVDRCPACQYDLRTISSNVCPECGTLVPPRRAIPPALDAGTPVSGPAGPPVP